MRSNDAAAAALQELADLIAISGGDPYRVRAYEKAARSVAGYPLDLDVLDRKGLKAIPAIGAHTAEISTRLASTVACAPNWLTSHRLLARCVLARGTV